MKKITFLVLSMLIISFISSCNYEEKKMLTHPFDELFRVIHCTVSGIDCNSEGPKGKDGIQCEIEELNESQARFFCDNGIDYIINDGQNGIDGIDGTDGESCTVNQLVNGSEIICTDGTHAVVLNGEDGADGADAPYAINEVIDPCGKETSLDEVLLLTSSGIILAHLDGGAKLDYLTILEPGTYQTTDGTKCNFTVNSDGTLTDDTGTTWGN